MGSRSERVLLLAIRLVDIRIPDGVWWRDKVYLILYANLVWLGLGESSK